LADRIVKLAEGQIVAVRPELVQTSPTQVTVPIGQSIGRR
jgi:hypothetical protein